MKPRDENECVRGRERERGRERADRLKDANFVFQRRDERVGGSYGVRSLEAAFHGSILGTARMESTVPPTKLKYQNRHRFPIYRKVESIAIYNSSNTNLRGSLSTVQKPAIVKNCFIILVGSIVVFMSDVLSVVTLLHHSYIVMQIYARRFSECNTIRARARTQNLLHISDALQIRHVSHIRISFSEGRK